MLPAPTAAAWEWGGGGWAMTEDGVRVQTSSPGTEVRSEHSEVGKTEDPATEQQLSHHEESA